MSRAPCWFFSPRHPPFLPLGGAGPDARRYENKLLVILFLGFGLVFFDRQALLFLVPFISEEIPSRTPLWARSPESSP
ncbi:hypothetical protein QQM39_39135 [Streptomyces sp. DT2A-34]|uniref:hypothetical protein n=1 Tax=Streptomyces sp. DT2A-34 TaxID=3051182 RepID=UPI00265C60EF|nr:hypothetical protein [Streptomyces sp. DT2A-34]MDO0916622.1 hypothetical protein [Streptomyces sp. DT2A-34]